MTRVGQILFGILLVLLFFQVLIGFPMPLEQKPESPTLATETGDALKDREQVMGKVHLVESREGKRDWELFAEQAVGSEGQGQWKLAKVKVHFYSGMSLEYTVTGDKGEIGAVTKDIKISGNVVTKSANGYVFQTSLVEYFAKDRTLRSQSPVQVQGPQAGLSVSGASMEALIDANVIHIRRNVVATKQLPDHKSFSVKADILTLSARNNSAKFKGQVRIEVDTLRIEGPEAEFEYRGEVDFVRSVVIQGGGEGQ